MKSDIEGDEDLDFLDDENILDNLNDETEVNNDNGDEKKLKEDYWGIIGYIVLRLNFATEDSVKWPAEDM